MSTYKKLQQACSDFRAVAASIEETKTTLAYLRDAIRRRMESDRAEAQQTISVLEATMADPCASDVVRHLVGAELENLKQITLSPSAAEREAYETELSNLKTAETDLRNLEYDFTETVARLEMEIAEIKAWMEADNTLSDLPTLIAAEEKIYEHLCEEVTLHE